MELVRPDDLVVDNSILKDVYACATRGAMSHVLGLTVESDAIELEAGSAVHEVLAWWASGKSDEESLARLEPYRKYAKEHCPPDDDRLSYRNVHRITGFWLRHHPLAAWEFVVKPENVEVPMIHPLGEIKGRRVVMVALLDVLAKRRTGGWWSVDHKTTKGINQWFEDDQDTSSQFTGQLWLAREKGLTLGGVYVNALEYPRLNTSTTRKCSTHGGVPYAECALKHVNARMFPVVRTAHEIDTWERTAKVATRKYISLLEKVKTIGDVHDSVEMDGRFKRQCSRCEFKEWCRMGRPPGSLKTFKKKKWNPLVHAQKHAETMKEAE